MKLTKKQADYFGQFVPDMIDYVASTIQIGATSVHGVTPDQALRNIANGMRSTTERWAAAKEVEAS